MSPIRSMARRPSASSSFAAVAAFATLMGVATLAAAQVADTCPPEHRKVDKKIHDLMHGQRSDRDSSERRQQAGRERSERPQAGRQRVIVRAKAGMRGALEAAGRNRGHDIRADHDFINAFSAEVDEDDLARLAADPRVESVSFDAAMQGDQVALEDPLTLIAQRLAKESRTTLVAFGTEAGLFKNAGIPTVVCGPGSITQAHQPDEYVTLEQLARCEQFLQGLAAAKEIR